MNKIRVLFLCIHNSARSQMAEAFLKKYASDTFEVMSAGLEPGTLNQNVVQVMKQAGIDISENKTKSAFDLYKKNMMFAYVIAVCDKEAAEQCPIFPGVTKRLHWPFEDPSQFTGEDALKKTAEIRDAIEAKVKNFVETIKSGKEIDSFNI